MGLEKMYTNNNQSHQPRYGDDDEVDGYSSGDDLGDDDLNILNTDYAAQRDLSFLPVQHQQQRYHVNNHNPSIPPSLRPLDSNTEYPDESSETSPHDRIDDFPDAANDQSDFGQGNDYEKPLHKARAYHIHRQRRPLIDLIRNEWQNSPYTSSHSSATSGDSTPSWTQVLSAPGFRRYASLIFAFSIFLWSAWHYWAGPQWGEHRLLGQSLKDRMKTGGGWFGENLRPEFVDMVHVRTLDRDLVPQHADGKRLIVVGDVHGCHDELVNLLAEAQYEARTDHLIFAGDFIAKGPSSPAVVDLAMSAHASCVRGNHEDRVLLAYRDMYSHRMTPEQKSKKVPPPPEPGMPENMQQNKPTTDDPLIEEQSFEHGGNANGQLAKSFTKGQIDYMSSCPVILDVGNIKGMGNVQVVHAGLVPGVRLERQDPMGVMHMRTIDLDTHVPSSSSKGMAWYKLWNRYQSMIPAHERSTVIYGHDSRRSLQLHDYSKGLDSGCVSGGKLTAMIIDNDVEGGEAKTVSVQCKDHRDSKKDVNGAVE